MHFRSDLFLYKDDDQSSYGGITQTRPDEVEQTSWRQNYILLLVCSQKVTEWRLLCPPQLAPSPSPPSLSSPPPSRLGPGRSPARPPASPTPQCPACSPCPAQTCQTSPRRAPPRCWTGRGPSPAVRTRRLQLEGAPCPPCPGPAPPSPSAPTCLK